MGLLKRAGGASSDATLNPLRLLALRFMLLQLCACVGDLWTTSLIAIVISKVGTYEGAGFRGENEI